MIKPFSLLVKPASADCNLRCEYCFYLEKLQLYPSQTVHRMSDATLEKMISSYMSIPMPNYSFGWQGGEPTLMGVDFFRKVTDLQQKYGRPGISVANGVQTNGTLLTDELAEHFRKYNFLLGVSLDGPAEIHDFYRKKIGGEGTHAAVLKGIDLLKKHRVEFNILVLVNSQNVTKAKELYHYYRELGLNYLQFIPCVEFDDQNQPLPFAITGKQWGDFMCQIYDLWHRTDTRKVSIRFFDSMMNLLVNGQRTICHIDKNCCQYFVVEHSGDVYPCDFFVKPELKLGNVSENSWEEMQNSSLYKEFGRQKPVWHQQCETCKHLFYCSGDCLKNRLYGSNANPRTISRLCEGWQQFFDHSISGFKKLAEKIKIEQAQAQAIQAAKQSPYSRPISVGRNDPCPCGSGKKYKKCCGR